MTRSECLEHLKRLGLLDEFNKNQLTFFRVTCALRINFKLIQKKLLEKGYPGVINKTTLLVFAWLPIIFRLQVPNNIRHVVPKKKKKLKRTPAPVNNILRRNWEKRKQEENDTKKSPRARIISIPMGGKVK
jgi:hypothetical protein